MFGVVLCGGRSLRMGTDKARLTLAGRTLVERAVDVLAQRAERTWLACGSESRYGELGLPLVLDRRADCGPLAGLEAALEIAAASAAAERSATSGAAWLLVLACDMPYAGAHVFDRLLARAREQDLDAALFASASGPEPLYGVYRTSVLPAVRAALAAGERKVIAFMRFPLDGAGDVAGDAAGGTAGEASGLARVGWLSEAELEPESAAEFALGVASNVNTPEDLLRARARWSSRHDRPQPVEEST